MKQGWEIKKLGEVCSFSQGIQVPIEEQYTKCEEGMIRFLRIIDFTQKGESPRYIQGVCDKYILHDDEIAIVRYGTPGFVCYGESGAIANNLFKITQKKAYFNHNYLRYWLQSDSFQSVIKSNKYGVALKAIKFSTINDIPIPIPPLAEQERIVAELDCLTGVIEKKKQQLKELDALAQSIFYEMFGDPITNEKGWEVKKFPDCYKLTSGKNLTSKNIIEGEFPVYGGNGIVGYHIDYNLDGDNIIIGRVGALCGNVRNVLGKAYITDNAFILSKIENRWINVFILYLLEIHNLRQYARDALQPVVSNSGFKNIDIILPPFTLQQAFASKIEAIEKQKELIKQSIKEVETLFNSRMDYYFN